MSVANILQKIGNWTTSKKLAEIVAKELGIAEKTAYERMKKEVNEGIIRKLTLPDRGVVYGLPNWPLKDDDLRLLIDAMKAHALHTEALAHQIEAWAKLIEATRGSKAN